jgi:hypothetical protein
VLCFTAYTCCRHTRRGYPSTVSSSAFPTLLGFYRRTSFFVLYCVILLCLSIPLYFYRKNNPH